MLRRAGGERVYLENFTKKTRNFQRNFDLPFTNKKLPPMRCLNCRPQCDPCVCVLKNGVSWGLLRPLAAADLLSHAIWFFLPTPTSSSLLEPLGSMNTCGLCASGKPRGLRQPQPQVVCEDSGHGAKPHDDAPGCGGRAVGTEKREDWSQGVKRNINMEMNTNTRHSSLWPSKTFHHRGRICGNNMIFL